MRRILEFKQAGSEPVNETNSTHNTDEKDDLRVRRETYEQYSVPKVDFPAWVLDRVAWRGDERVLDVGSGVGAYYEALRQRVPDIRYQATDLTHESLQQHPAAARAQSDAQSLPFVDHSFDVVMANHMLFHVGNIDAALGEFRRILKPDGLLITATNSIHTMPEFQALMRRALVLLGSTARGQVQPPPLPHHRYSLENGTLHLRRHFFAVVRYDLPTTLIFNDVDPVMTYLESTRELREAHLPPGMVWEDLMLVMREQIIALMSHFGELAINKVSGVLLASDRGGFIHDFVARRNGTGG
jgi:SAM-dependent methyltransferase